MSLLGVRGAGGGAHAFLQIRMRRIAEETSSAVMLCSKANASFAASVVIDFWPEDDEAIFNQA